MLNTREKAIRAAQLADDKKAEHILVLDVTRVCSFTDAFVICTANSSMQLRAIASSIEDGLKKQGTKSPLSDGLESPNWVVLDYGDVVVHIMSSDARGFYNLEGIWGDAARMDWEHAEVPVAARK